MPKFSIGEVVIVNRPQSPFHGTETTVLSRPYPQSWYCEWTGQSGVSPAYSVAPPPGHTGRWCLEEHEMRKRPPPRADLDVVRWDDCPWQPDRIEV